MYGVIIVLLPCVYFYDVVVYKLEGRVGMDPPLPWWMPQTLDVLWAICIICSSRLAPPEPPILVRHTVLEFGNYIELDEHERV